MKRFIAAFATAALLAALVPGVASAARVIKFVEDSIFVGCGGEIDGGGFANAFAERGIDYEFGGIEIYDGDDLVLFGFVEDIDVVEGTEIVLSATIPLIDADLEDAGVAELEITVAPDGEPYVDEGFDFGNINSHTLILRQPLIGTGTITMPDASEIEIDCSGESAKGQVFETSPNAFTAHREGVAFECFWDTGDTFYLMFGQTDSEFGESLDVGWFTIDSEVFVDEPFVGSIDASGVEASIHLSDFSTGDEYTATIDATFSPDGDPVTSTIVEDNRREKLVQQLLSVDGTFAIDGGPTLVMDDEACNANVYSSSLSSTNPQGPRGGKAPANDTPEGALALEAGSSLNQQTTGTAPDAEAANELCDEGFIDQMGHTVWYTVEGTGEEMTFDTAGSNFDTVVAVYVMEGDELVEIACVDDVFGDPAGISLQAAITGPTEEGVTYWIQVGGWGVEFFGEGQSGRLRVAVS